MRPLSSERLPEPILLPGCPGVRIVEWRPTPGYATATRPSNRAIAHLDGVCASARRAFAAFASTEGFVPAPTSALNVDVCLMPAAQDRGGDDYRNLNDVASRFRARQFEHQGYDASRVWGYHQRSTGTVYMRNDVLRDDGSWNPRFATVFAHEMFHAMSYESGAYEQHRGNKELAEETMARRFTRSLGLGE
jgi:hypothetical protein